MPGTSIASDYTGMYQFFVVTPLLVLGISFLILCFWVPLASLIILALLLPVHIVVIIWASDVGYMDTAGGWTMISFLINLVGLAMAIIKRQSNSNNQQDSDQPIE